MAENEIGKVIHLHGRDTGTTSRAVADITRRRLGASLRIRALSPEDHERHKRCKWFRSCKARPEHFVMEDGEEVPVCEGHLAVVAATRQLKALGQERAFRLSEVDKVEDMIADELWRARTEHGESFPVTDMARVVDASRTTIIRWLLEQEKREQS